jgi:hypothetical protein
LPANPVIGWWRARHPPDHLEIVPAPATPVTPTTPDPDSATTAATSSVSSARLTWPVGRAGTPDNQPTRDPTGTGCHGNRRLRRNTITDRPRAPKPAGREHWSGRQQFEQTPTPARLADLAHQAGPQPG